MTKNEKGREIQLKFSKKDLKRYLLKFNFQIDQKLESKNIEIIFIKTIDDYNLGIISLDDLSSICNYLWSLIPAADRFGSKLATTLYSASELFYYERSIQNSDEAGRIFMTSLKKILTYKKI